MASPTQRTLIQVRKLGGIAQVVEKWNPYAKIRQDLFGCIDIVALVPGQAVLGIQATSGSNVSSRVTKSKATPAIRRWLESGALFEVWGWTQPTKTRRTWALRVVTLSLHDFPTGECPDG